VEELIVRLGKEGIQPSKIGIVLRDQYSVTSVKQLTGKKVAQILASHEIKPSLPEDLTSLILLAVKMSGHVGRHKKDFTMRRSFEITEARINALAKHYKQKGILPREWKYDRERAALLVRG